MFGVRLGANQGPAQGQVATRVDAVFFEEEEHRIHSALERALAHAQRLAGQLPLVDLLEELSQGLRLSEPIKSSAIVLAPSYWCTPLVFMGETAARQDIWLFGARLPTESLVPGEVVPDTLLRELDALSDPTRLRILQYLSAEPLAPAQLARRLRLRTPTVTHHLQTLRLAGLVHITLGTGKEPRTYATRSGAVAALFASLEGFLSRAQPGEGNAAASAAPASFARRAPSGSQPFDSPPNE